MKSAKWISETMPNTGGWKQRHKLAIIGFHPVAQAIRAWCAYAEEHERKFKSKIGDDYVLGPAWAQWGFALRAAIAAGWTAVRSIRSSATTFPSKGGTQARKSGARSSGLT